MSTRPLSYAKAADLIPILTRSALSARGEVQVDPRTNTIIIRDLPDRLTAAAELMATLDLPQPQVEIEARIVQTTRDFARSLGVEWGFNGRVSPDLGNTTGLAFPNNGSLTGRTGNIQGPEGRPDRRQSRRRQRLERARPGAGVNRRSGSTSTWH